MPLSPRISAPIALAALLAGCRPTPSSAPPGEDLGPRLDVVGTHLALRSIKPAPLAVGDGPLTLVRNGAPSVFKKALVIGDQGMLKVIASTSTAFNCDAPAAPLGPASLEATFDPGPDGDYYAGRATSPMVTIALPNDGGLLRDLPPASTRIEVQPFHEGDELVTMKFAMHASLAKPDPKVPTTVVFSGRADATICPSAFALVPGAGLAPEGPARITVGARTFEAGSVLAFFTSDERNPAEISGVAFYEAPGATCAAAMRALADNGGGVDGLQIQTGPVAVSAAESSLGAPHPIVARARVVTTGNAWFEEHALGSEPLRGFIHLGSARLDEEGGALYGAIRAETKEGGAGDHLAVEGLFAAKVCKPLED